MKEDVLLIGSGTLTISPQSDTCRILHPSAPPDITPADHPLRILPGPEWARLGDAGQQQLTNTVFSLSPRSDRMAILLQGNPIDIRDSREMMSAPVTFGTVQRLPDGTLMILAADHQTTGGYPRVAHVISADLGRLVQQPANTSIRFALTTLETAERLDSGMAALISQWQPVFSQQLRIALENVD
jgi:antagonist of KipI